MKRPNIIDNNPFCSICGGTEENAEITHINIKVCDTCAEKLTNQVEEMVNNINNQLTKEDEKVY